MKHAFFATSSIEVDPSKIFKGTAVRSYFNTQQRLEQTINALLTLNFRDPTADIYLIESSITRFNEIQHSGIKNLHYISLQDLNPAVAEIVRTHSNKSYCECMMILEFLKHYKSELTKYDFLTKISGRYTISEEFNTDYFKPWNTNKFFMKPELAWTGSDIDFFTEEQLPRDMLVNGVLYGFHAVLHAFGKDKLDQYEAIISASALTQMEHGKYYHQDVEYTLYLYMRVFDLLKDVIIVDWYVNGQSGITGNMVRY